MPVCQITGKECPTLDEHHIIPREYGGEDALTIMIDPGLHQQIHRVAENPNLEESFLSSFEGRVKTRVKTLIDLIRMAKVKWEDEKKTQTKIKIILEILLDKEDVQKLDSFCKVLGLSRSDLVRNILLGYLGRMC